MMSRMRRRHLTSAALVVALVAGVCVLAAALGVWLDLWTFRTGFTLLRYGAWAGLAGLILAVIALLMGPSRVVALAALVVAALSLGIPWSWQQQARNVPPIHDISTDLDDPPAFVAIVPLRAHAANPVEYAGPETAAQQREGYPDLQTRHIPLPPTEALAAAERTARALRWTVVDVDAASGRLEAYETTFWFRFTDDVVVRVRPADGGSRIDVRSKSRVGRSDVGTNAARIRRFLDALERP